jgi:two-component system response regulator QseB
MRALIVEDDPMIGRAVMAGLRSAGYAADWVRDGHDGETVLSDETYDIALLDLALPRRNGLEILKALRRAKSQLAVVIITASDSVANRVAGLDGGADDYVTKPFDLDELLARMRAVIRRRSGRSCPEITYGTLTIDPSKKECLYRGAPVQLSAREFAVLEALMKEPGTVVSRSRLEDTVYGWGKEIESNSVEVHLHHLRRKLQPELIRNVRGVGYRIALID